VARPRRITIFDTTLRDGEQSPGIALSPDEKAEIAQALERLGVDVIEAGFAASSRGDFEGVRTVAAAVTRPTVASIARTCREDLDAAIEAGAAIINLPDTVGYCLPDGYGAFLSDVRSHLPELDDVALSVHCHNDLGLAVANSLAGVAAGASQVECTVNGIGERAGNAALEEVVMAMRVHAEALGCETGVNVGEIGRVSQLVSQLTGYAVQRNKAIVGASAFAHEAGIHQDGMLKDASTYQIIDPEEVGLTMTLPLGKHSGRHAFRRACEQAGVRLAPEELTAAFRRFKQLADTRKSVTLYDVFEEVAA
jgi:2-isopropylmalate synthase